MKKILLFLSIFAVHPALYAQDYTSDFKGNHLIQVAEKILDWTQQPGLISVSEQIVDSMQNQTFDANTAVWQPDYQKYYSYDDAILQKEVLKGWNLNTENWQAEQQNTFYYQPNQQLEKTLHQKWDNAHWQSIMQEICVYNEAQLVKTYQQLWQSDTETWQDYEVGQISYYENGLAESLATAAFSTNTHIWQEKDYRAYVYKAEHSWISEEVYLRWDAAQQSHLPHSKAVGFYSSQLLKGVEFYHWDNIAKDWVVHAQAICDYDANFQLIGLDIERLLSDGQTWEHEANCRFYWGEALVSTVEAVTEDNLYLLLPNPYQESDIIRLQRGLVFMDLDYHLYDMQGRLSAMGEVPGSGEWMLPRGLNSGLYVLVVMDDFGAVLVSHKIIVR